MTAADSVPPPLFAAASGLAARHSRSVTDVLAATFLALARRSSRLVPGGVRINRTPVAIPAASVTLNELLADTHGLAGTPVTLTWPDDEPEVALNIDGDTLRWHLAGPWANMTLERELPSVYLHVLASAVAAPDAPIGDLDLLSPKHIALLDEWAGPADEFPVTACVHELVQEQAAANPNAVAVARKGVSLTYRELNAQANQLARVLREHGAGPETTVALLMERSPEMLVAFLAVFKSGAAAVLLDPAHPAQRIRQVLDVSAPRALLTLGRLGLPVLDPDLPTVLVDVDWARIHLQPNTDLNVPVHADGLAYVVHTSGSTGEPKRVAVLHRSVAHSIRTHQQGHRITSDDRAAWLAPPGSSVSVGELWPYLSAGASVHVAEPGVIASPTDLRDWLVRERITKAYVSMPMAENVFTLDWPANAALRLLTVGSDKVRRWASPELPFEVAVAIGSSEANGISSGLVPWERRLTSATATDADRSGPPPVGRAWPGVRLLLLDDDLRRVPPGAVGELYVGGPELARGYLGDPAQTAQRFLPDPFGPPGSRLYRTGDLARWADGGLLHHCGRVDHEVKVRGFRVDPAEVEAALLTHPAVRDTVVVPVTHPDGSRQLAAYLVTSDALSAAALRDHVAARLPAHLVPAAYESLPDLPRTVNGKVDRHALPDVTWAAPRAAYREPGDELERTITAVFAEVLRIDRIGVLDDFFQLGGDSLSGTRLTARITERLRARVTVRTLLKNPTPAALAEHLRSAGGHRARREVSRAG